MSNGFLAISKKEKDIRGPLSFLKSTICIDRIIVDAFIPIGIGRHKRLQIKMED